MDTNGFNIFFQEDEDYLDDPISLLDFEEHTVFSGSENYLKNITIEDPGYVVNISVEDYELRLQKSLSKFKELKKSKESNACSNKNGYLLRKCRSCSIKVVDYRKFPWYYRNKLGSTNKTRYTENNVVEIKEKGEDITIIDLTGNEHVEYNNHNDDRIQGKFTNNIEKLKANGNEFTSIDNSVDGKVEKQTYISLSKPVLNNQNESRTKAPRSEVDEATDLIISTYTRLTDKAIQKLKTNIESFETNKNLGHNLGKNLLLASKSFTEPRDNLLTACKDGQKVAKVSTDNINNDCKNDHHKKNSNKSNKFKNVYTSEQISKTKIKIKKSSLKSKDVISSKNNYNEKKKTGCNLNQITTNREQYDSLKNIVKKHNTNAKQQNREQNCNQNKQERIQHNSYSYLSLSSPVLTKKNSETKKSTLLPNQNTAPDKFDKCDKQIFSADRIIPHFHNNAFLNHSDILSKTNSNQHPKRSKDTNIEIYKTKNIFDPKALTQIPNPSIHKKIYDYCIENNNLIVDNNEPHNKIYNTNDISNISAIHSVKSSQVAYKPICNGIILERSASPNNVNENINNINLINQNKKNLAQEEERLQYLLPSNLLDSRNQKNISN